MRVRREAVPVQWHGDHPQHHRCCWCWCWCWCCCCCCWSKLCCWYCCRQFSASAATLVRGKSVGWNGLWSGARTASQWVPAVAGGAAGGRGGGGWCRCCQRQSRSGRTNVALRCMTKLLMLMLMLMLCCASVVQGLWVLVWVLAWMWLERAGASGLARHSLSPSRWNTAPLPAAVRVWARPAACACLRTAQGS